jgi:hypothetical protein
MAAATAATDDACRFCFEGPEPENPLITPCKCIGSMKYVHVQCIKTWRRNTTNHEWIHKCQLCLEDYEIFLRWQKEDEPRQVAFLNLLTKRHVVVSVMFYYFHLTFLSLVPVTMSQNPPLDSLTIHTIQDVKSPYTNLQHLYFTHISYFMYLGMLFGISGLYFYTYYKSFWKYIQNKKLYAYLWLGCISDGGIFQTPLMTIFMLLISGMFSAAFLSPLAFGYIYTLSSVYEIHLTIIRRINDHAEIF